MNREGHDNVKFFVGPEVEHTPAYSKKTLFVVGQQDVHEIIKYARSAGAPHVFMGANHSFNADLNDAYWDKTITELLDRGFWVTLDYQAYEHDTVLKMLNPGIWQSRIFVPLVGVRIPKFAQSSVNLTVKIDDVDFNATNEGVWCFHFRELMDSNRFTDWNDYSNDSVITDTESTSEPIAVPKSTPKPVVTEAPTETPTETPTSAPEVLNNTELGLDTAPVTTLKPETSDESIDTLDKDDVKGPEDAAAAYADGATTDPLSEEPVKKVKAKK